MNYLNKSEWFFWICYCKYNLQYVIYVEATPSKPINFDDYIKIIKNKEQNYSLLSDIKFFNILNVISTGFQMEEIKIIIQTMLLKTYGIKIADKTFDYNKGISKYKYTHNNYNNIITILIQMGLSVPVLYENDGDVIMWNSNRDYFTV